MAFAIIDMKIPNFVNMESSLLEPKVNMETIFMTFSFTFHYFHFHFSMIYVMLYRAEDGICDV